MQFLAPENLPVLIAGMWAGTPDDPESGARILVQKKPGGIPIISGFSDTNGEFRGQLPATFAGKRLRIVISDPGFQYDSYDSVKVERWGLFLPVRAKKDMVYNGSGGAEPMDPDRWANWNESKEFAAASEKTHSAARIAKMIWPLGYVSVLVALVVGLGTLPLGSIPAVLCGGISAVALNWLSRWLLVRGY